MMMSAIAAAALLLAGCGGAPAEKKAEAPVKKKKVIADETHHFPAEGRVEARVVEDHVLGREFLPGGNVAHYRRGKQEFDMFLIRTAVPEAAALMLFDYKKRMENPKLIAHFGGLLRQGRGPDGVRVRQGTVAGGRGRTAGKGRRHGGARAGGAAELNGGGVRESGSRRRPMVS